MPGPSSAAARNDSPRPAIARQARAARPVTTKRPDIWILRIRSGIERVAGWPYFPRVISQLSTSAFSATVHSRPTTSLQLRRNHFSVLAASVKRSGLNAGASGAIDLPVAACRPVCVGGFPWQDAQLHSRPCLDVKNSWPRDGSEGLRPALDIDQAVARALAHVPGERQRLALTPRPNAGRQQEETLRLASRPLALRNALMLSNSS